MTARAFIIAIEDYPGSTSLASTLPGTIADAGAFRKWVIEKKGVAAENVFACTNPNVEWKTSGAKRDEIVDELLKMVAAGQNDTSELYFFFSGHGFTYVDSPYENSADVLVASDFIDLDNSGGECLKLQEIRTRLWKSLGPGDHYYFIDACRTPINEEDIQVLGLGKRFPDSFFSKPTWYTLYSTAQGLAAKTTSGFVNHLVEGLNGKGRAKRWEMDRMYVTFDVLSDFMKQRVPGQEIDAIKWGPGKGFILELNPVPNSDCKIEIENAADDDRFHLKIRNPLGTGETHTFQGNTFQIPVKPFHYFFEILHPQANVVQIDPPSKPVDLYDSCRVRFQKQLRPAPSVAPPPPPAAAAPGPAAEDVYESAVEAPLPESVPESARVVVKGAPNATIELQDLASGETVVATGKLSKEVFPGTYRLKMRELGVTIDSRKLELEAGQTVRVNLLQKPESKVRKRIREVASHPADPGLVNFSEQLGEMANQDLSVWLSIMGASRIVAPYGDFSQLSRLPLETFDDVQIGDSPVYVLAGFENLEGPFGIALSDGPNADWQSLREVSGLVGVYEYRFPSSVGFHCLSLKMPKRAVVTLSVYCLPNRVTFVVFEADGKSRLKMSQYLLPMHSRMQYLDPMVAHYLGPFLQRPLESIRMMALAQSRFVRNRPVEPPAGSHESNLWTELIYGKWLDPIMSLMAGYELIRRGQLEKDTFFIHQMITNLRLYFSGIADIEILAKLAGLHWIPPDTPPLFLDGLLYLDDMSALPLSAAKINYNEIWTSWLNAVAVESQAANTGDPGGSFMQLNEGLDARY